MELLRYTLLADGTSDRSLIPIIDWLIAQHAPAARVLPAFARDVHARGQSLRDRLSEALRNFPCDLLFVHRDAEAMPREDRLREIREAMRGQEVAFVPVVPVRMTEAWLLSDEAAIRFAAGNASGRQAINLPGRRQWETLPDPKKVLLDALALASGRTGRRLAGFAPERARALVTPRTESFAGLRGLSAFDAFERDLIEQLEKVNTNALD